MKIFDLHNDALTGGGKATEEDVIYAVWTTELSCERTEALLSDNKDVMLAVEDCEKVVYTELPDNVMYCGLTWNGANSLAGGAYSDGRLTDLGREFIDMLNEREIVLDTAHLNRTSFFEATERANRIICSHTCFYDVNAHPRNLTNEEISVIIQKDGIVGLCFVGDFLGEATTEAVVRHIDWFVSRYGDAHLAIGTDFYGSTSLPPKIRSYSGIKNLVLALIRLGYPDKTIQNIVYDNANTYFNKKERSS